MNGQDRPLAPASSRYSSEENGLSAEQSKRQLRKRKGVICCSCCAIATLIIGLIILILFLTVFKIKSPKLSFDSLKIVGLNAALKQRNNPQTGLNVTFSSDLAIKNPNSASYKFTNATTTMYYGGVVIGEVRNPPGNAKAHKTIHMNITIDVQVDSVVHVPRLNSDIIAGEMPIGTFTGLKGRVNAIGIKKHVDVEMNCTMILVISTQAIKDKVCKKKVHI